MGFGTVIAGIYVIGMLLLSFYVFANSVNHMSTMSWESLQNNLKINLERVGSSLNVANISMSADRTRLYVNLTNTGEIKIPRNQFAEIDVLVTYTDAATGFTQTYWCYYNSSDTTQVRWTLNSTISPNPSPSILDPLDWDPSKTLAITIQLAGSSQIKSDSTGYVKVIMPGGSSNGRYFDTA